MDVFIAGDKKFVGSGSADMPKLSSGKSRGVAGNLETADTANASKLDRLYADTSVSANENIDLSLQLAKLPACSDDIDNDGDGAIDENDTWACTDLDGNYDPQDDNEILKRFTRGTFQVFNDSISVSTEPGQRAAEIRSASNPLPWSVTVAKGEIKHWIEVQRSDSISNQMHATHLKTGASNDNLTVEKTSDVVEDADTSNGFVRIRVYGIDRSFFADGPYYGVYGWHGCKARGNCGSIEGSGKFYYFAEQQNGRGHDWSFVYEPEDVPEQKTKSAVGAVVGHQAPTLTKVGQCEPISRTDEICRVPAKSGKF